jgi:multidrug efflux pump subunit AcrA (membrane-fusion protein)
MRPPVVTFVGPGCGTPLSHVPIADSGSGRLKTAPTIRHGGTKAGPHDSFALATGALIASLALAGCGAQSQEAAADAAPPPAIAITAAPVTSQPIARTLRVTGSLFAGEQAEVSAETPGRITATPVERGTRVARGAVLVRISAAEAEAQVREAEANAAQIEARLGLQDGQVFDPARAEAEFARIQSLLDQRVVSQSEFDQRWTQVEAARQQYQAAQNAAQQSYRSLEGARARMTLVQKALADTTVRAPFTGLVAERRVSVGDYVTRGTPVATVVSIDPLRVQLSVPEQFVGLVQAGQAVRFAVDAYPGQTFEGQIRYVSPALRADQRALTVEAIVPNRDGLLKPGLFATAEIQQPTPEPALLVPASALQTIAGTRRVFVVHGDRVEERIVKTGQTVGTLVEIVEGVAADEVVAADGASQLTDGAAVRVDGTVATTGTN